MGQQDDIKGALMRVEFRVHELFGSMAEPEARYKAGFSMIISPRAEINVPLPGGKVRQILIIESKAGDASCVLSYGQEGAMPSIAFTPLADRVQLRDHLASLGCTDSLLQQANDMFKLRLPLDEAAAAREAESLIRHVAGSRSAGNTGPLQKGANGPE